MIGHFLSIMIVCKGHAMATSHREMELERDEQKACKTSQILIEWLNKSRIYLKSKIYIINGF